MSHQVDLTNTADHVTNREQAELERLKRLRYEAADTQKDWVDKFADGETRRYRFIYDERTEYKLKHFKDGDEGRMLFHFRVLDLDDPQQLKYGRDQEFLLAKTHAAQILDQLINGHYTLEITRRGSSNFGTRYEVRPILTQGQTAAA